MGDATYVLHHRSSSKVPHGSKTPVAVLLAWLSSRKKSPHRVKISKKNIANYLDIWFHNCTVLG